MSINTLALIIVGCLFLVCIGMVLWNNRPEIKDWFEHHHWPRFH